MMARKMARGVVPLQRQISCEHLHLNFLADRMHGMRFPPLGTILLQDCQKHLSRLMIGLCQNPTLLVIPKKGRGRRGRRYLKSSDQRGWFISTHGMTMSLSFSLF